MPDSLLSDLLSLGVRPGGVLLVHASLRSLGPLPGAGSPAARAETVIQALLDVLGPGGTLLFPALSYETVNQQQPVFDVRATPSCVGALPEYFRTRAGTLRSIHPTHSVCGVGRRAAELLAGHELDTTPCGEHSPFARLPGVDGQVLFLGCGMRPNTSMHAIEEHVLPPYLFGDPLEYQIIRADGSPMRMRVTRHNFKGCAQRYDRLAEVMRRGLRQGQVLQAACHLVETAEMWPAALDKLRVDSLYFVEPTGSSME
jgi:aminoglycoside 3-N-acetyltransferase